MRGGALPPALLFAALGLAMAFAPRRVFPAALGLLAVTAFVGSGLAAPAAWRDTIFMGCWISIVLTAASTCLPRGLSASLTMILALNAGLWGGGVIACSGARSDLLISLPTALLCLPGAWLVSSKRQIVIRVVAGWLVAVALLAGSLQVTTPTPGYAPDHMD